MPSEPGRRPDTGPGDAVRRVRLMAGGVVVLNWLVTADAYGFEQPTTRLVVLSVCSILLVNILTRRGLLGGRTLGGRGWMLEIGVDVVWTVAVCVAAPSPEQAPWIVLLIPVIGGVVRSSMSSALFVWVLVFGGYAAGRIAQLADSDDLVSSELSAIVEQLGLILLVAVPAGYLAEQLVSDGRRARRAADLADLRSGLLQHVADVGTQVTRLDADAADAVCRGGRLLGFHHVDAVGWTSSGWVVLGSSSAGAFTVPPLVVSAPVGASPASGATADASSTAGATRVVPIRAGGLEDLVVVPIDHGDHPVLLRAATAEGVHPSPDQLAALHLLARQASVALRNGELVETLRRMHLDLDHQAKHDALTGLPNRTAFASTLDAAVRHPGSHPGSTAVLFLDLDGFKPVNDLLGHEAGDRLLRIIAARLRGAVRADDVVARLGGDEFTVVMRRSGEDEVLAAAQRLVDVVAEPVALDGDTVRVGVSIGVASLAPGLDGAELLRRADAAMYQAKAAGRGTVLSYAAELDAAAQRRLRITADIEDAVAVDALTLHYQPMFDVNRLERIVGVEALLRWDHPVLGPVAPDEIIEAARARRLARPLTRWILSTAIHELASFRGGEDWSLSVNVAAHELRDPAFVETVVGTLAEGGLEPGRLWIEIGEADGLDEHGRPHLDRLRAHGVRLVIDDWGRSGTSLAQLALPIDAIKLDPRLLGGDDGLNRLIIGGLAGIAAERGVLLVAEGIERPEDLELVRNAGCGYAQGYLLSRPLPAAALAGLANSGARP
jgi:diguanylate cyclase (GGDEF)-like protein